jgi:tRNA threonylcarbamoyladenosine biosynthesis protein TsaE
MTGGDWSLCAHSDSPGRTRALAASVARCCRAGDLVLLVGGLGAGKTVFAQGFAAAIGVAGPVTSPTFTLVRQYPCEGPGGIRQLVHADLYRLDHLTEVSDLALAELVEDRAVGLVEWGERGAPVLGDSVLVVALSWPGETDDAAETREVSVTGRGPAWSARNEEIAAALQPFGAPR